MTIVEIFFFPFTQVGLGVGDTSPSLQCPHQTLIGLQGKARQPIRVVGGVCRIELMACRMRCWISIDSQSAGWTNKNILMVYGHAVYGHALKAFLQQPPACLCGTCTHSATFSKPVSVPASVLSVVVEKTEHWKSPSDTPTSVPWGTPHQSYEDFPAMDPASTTGGSRETGKPHSCNLKTQAKESS